MFGLPEKPPKIEIKKLDKKPFDVECREFGFAFIVPEIGNKSYCVSYEYPEFWEFREREVTRKAEVHHVECFEVRCRSYNVEESLIGESYNYIKIDREYMRCYAFLYEHDNIFRIRTWKDYGFNEDWNYDPGDPVKIIDVGKWQWIDDSHFTEGKPNITDQHINPNGTSLWRIRIDNAEHVALRVLEVSKDSAGTMLDTFVNEEGKVILARRFNGPRWAYGKKWTLIDGKPREWTEVLPESPRVYYNDIPFVLWDFSIPSHAFVNKKV